VKEAVIAGHDGNVWATSPGMGAQPAELKTLRNLHDLITDFVKILLSKM
jgi:hypothetical protein